ncbi:MAG TPA: HAD hydrolase-like protein [Dehalococcoidia bacterium]|nr:HAD hydrolase-like protein [Dehalococcoidia bacterium]
MKYEAVIFDFGGTLVRSLAWAEYEKTTGEIAEIISVPRDEFVRLYFQHAERPGKGEFTSYQDYFRYIANLLEITPTDRKIENAAENLFNSTRKMVEDIRPDAVELLSWLKSRDYKTGLISDCWTDIPELWDETPFARLIDSPIFSCYVGMNKADIRIFQMAVERLDVSPESCVYVADGMRDELANAAKLGMHVIQILVPEEIDSAPTRENWNDPTISTLSEIKEFLR